MGKNVQYFMRTLILIITIKGTNCASWKYIKMLPNKIIDCIGVTSY